MPCFTIWRTWFTSLSPGTAFSPIPYSSCQLLIESFLYLNSLSSSRCDMNPHWIRDNEVELRRVYGGVKAVSVAFPSTEGGLLECIFEQVRKESLAVLEECIPQWKYQLRNWNKKGRSSYCNTKGFFFFHFFFISFSPFLFPSDICDTRCMHVL